MMEIKAPLDEKRIVLHTCCAPCSGAIIECMVHNGLKPVVFFSNSNITPESEYLKRLEEVRRYAASFDLEVVEDDYDHAAWLEAIKGLENEPERGLRCAECFLFRLRRAALWASAHNGKVLATSLASSRWKDLTQVGIAGDKACRETLGAVNWWDMNWRKGGLQPRRQEIIREQNFYNQNWCGCEFSRRISPSADKKKDIQANQ